MSKKPVTRSPSGSDGSGDFASSSQASLEIEEVPKKSHEGVPEVALQGVPEEEAQRLRDYHKLSSRGRRSISQSEIDMYKSRRSGHTSSRRADLSTSAPHALVDFKPADDTANAQPELTAKPNGAHIRKSSSGAVLERRKESVANGLATRGTSHAQNGPNQRPVVATHPDWLVEEPSVDVQTPTLVVHQSLYQMHYYNKPHVNFVITEDVTSWDNKKETLPKAIVSVLIEAEKSLANKYLGLNYSHRALVQDEQGSGETILHGLPSNDAEEFTERVQNILQTHLATKDAKVNTVSDQDDSFTESMRQFESKFSREVNSMKIAVLYAKPGQNDISQIWENSPPKDSPFYKFLDLLGDKVVMGEDWKGYRGEVGVVGADRVTQVYYKKWQHTEVIFHVAPLLNEEQHRRLCGNDIGVLIYHDSVKHNSPAEKPASSKMPEVDSVLIDEVVKALHSLDPADFVSFSRQFFSLFLEIQGDFMPHFEDRLASDEAVVNFMHAILGMVARVANEDPSVSQSTFNDRKSFYVFNGVDAPVFETWSACLIQAIKGYIGEMFVFTEAHEAAWKQLMTILMRLLLGEVEYSPKRPPTFVPFPAHAMGQVPQIIGVVEPHDTQLGMFRLGFFQRPSIGTFAPQSPPSSYFFKSEAVAGWLLAKFYNGFNRANEVPPLDKLFVMPRREALKALYTKFQRQIRQLKRSVGSRRAKSTSANSSDSERLMVSDKERKKSRKSLRLFGSHSKETRDSDEEGSLARSTGSMPHENESSRK